MYIVLITETVTVVMGAAVVTGLGKGTVGMKVVLEFRAVEWIVGTLMTSVGAILLIRVVLVNAEAV